MTMIAVRFALRSMLPSRCQLLIRGPKVRCSRNQLFSLFEDRANAKAATNRNGVVGNRGSTTPTAPTATAARPASSQRNRVSAFTLAVHHTRTGRGKSGSTVFCRDGVSLPRYQTYVPSGQSFARETSGIDDTEHRNSRTVRSSDPNLPLSIGWLWPKPAAGLVIHSAAGIDPKHT